MGLINDLLHFVKDLFKHLRFRKNTISSDNIGKGGYDGTTKTDIPRDYYRNLLKEDMDKLDFHPLLKRAILLYFKPNNKYSEMHLHKFLYNLELSKFQLWILNFIFEHYYKDKIKEVFGGHGFVRDLEDENIK